MPSVDGIVSGFDTTALINSIASAYSIPLGMMQTDVDRIKDQLDKVAGLSNRLEDLSTAIGKLQGDDGLVAFSAKVSTEGTIAATAKPGAAPGSYTIDVQSLASNETEVSVGVADKAAHTLGTGTFSVTYAGVTTDITLDGSNNSLEDLAAAIDALDGVSAYVMNTRDGANPYKLVVQGDDTGAANTISLDASGLSGGTTALSFTEPVSAADAVLSVNNVTVYSADNTFGGIPGVSVDLLKSGQGPVRLDVAVDDDAVVENVKAFVDAYNAVRSYYDQNSSFNTEEGIKGPLVGDSTARRVMETLGRLVSTAAPVAGSPFEALSQIGIKTNQDGSLSLDEDALRERVGEDLEGVRALFSAEDGPMGVLKTTIDDTFVDTDNGTLSSRTDSLQASLDDLELRMEAQQVRLDDRIAALREKFTAMEQVMAQFEGTGAYLTAMFTQKSSS